MAASHSSEDRSGSGGHRRRPDRGRSGRTPEDPGSLGRQARYTIRLSRSAEADIEEIRVQLARERGESFAARMLDDLADRFERQERFPEMGAQRANLGARPVRLLVWKAWILVYEHDGTRVFVARVLHGHRDIPEELHRDPGST